MTPGRFPRAGLAVLGVVLAAGSARGAGLRGVGDGWLVAPADVVAIVAARGPAVTSGGGVWLAVGQARMWGLAELPVRELDAGLGLPVAGGWARVGAGWQRTGTGAFQVDRTVAWAGWDGSWGLRLVASRKSVRGDPGTAAARAQWHLDGGPALRVGRRGLLRLRAFVALSAAPPASRDLVPLGRLILRHAGAAIGLAWDRRPGDDPVFGGELCLAVSRTVAMGVRFDGASRSLGPELAVRVGAGLLRTSHVVHPVLGVTHRVQLAVGAGRAIHAPGP
jgi:hypothetical protein